MQRLAAVTVGALGVVLGVVAAAGACTGYFDPPHAPTPSTVVLDEVDAHTLSLTVCDLLPGEDARHDSATFVNRGASAVRVFLRSGTASGLRGLSTAQTSQLSVHAYGGDFGQADLYPTPSVHEATHLIAAGGKFTVNISVRLAAGGDNSWQRRTITIPLDVIGQQPGASPPRT